MTGARPATPLLAHCRRSKAAGKRRAAGMERSVDIKDARDERQMKHCRSSFKVGLLDGPMAAGSRRGAYHCRA